LFDGHSTIRAGFMSNEPWIEATFMECVGAAANRIHIVACFMDFLTNTTFCMRELVTVHLLLGFKDLYGGVNFSYH
jgi:hypothetical protein